MTKWIKFMDKNVYKYPDKNISQSSGIFSEHYYYMFVPKWYTIPLPKKREKGFKLLVIIFNFTISLHSSSCCICLHTICHKEMEKMEELTNLHFWCIECHTTLPDWRYFGLACRVSREFHQFIAISHAEECCLTPRWQLTNKQMVCQLFISWIALRQHTYSPLLTCSVTNMKNTIPTE